MLLSKFKLLSSVKVALGGTFGCVGQQPQWCDDLLDWSFFPRTIFSALMCDSHVNRNSSLGVALTGSLDPLQDRVWYSLQAPLLFARHWELSLLFTSPSLGFPFETDIELIQTAVSPGWVKVVEWKELHWVPRGIGSFLWRSLHKLGQFGVSKKQLKCGFICVVSWKKPT